MTTQVYRDPDASLSLLEDQLIGIIGYGNQGSAQAKNLRDSGIEVIVGSIQDETAERAKVEGFAFHTIEDTAKQADIIFLLIPDEVQEEVYEEKIRPHLRAGKILNFAHGYNLHFGRIVPPSNVDVIMVAPRMVGANVRRAYEKGGGVPAYIAVWQDASGQAKEIALALSKAIGCTRAGVIETSVAAETELDLFTEQAIWPVIMRDFQLGFEVLVDAGFPPEVVALELYGSGEAAEIFTEMARIGFYKQGRLHSRTSQYGMLTRGERMLPDEFKERMRTILDEIRSGEFAREWREEQEKGFPVFDEVRERALRHPINEAEETARELIDPSLLG